MAISGKIIKVRMMGLAERLGLSQQRVYTYMGIGCATGIIALSAGQTSWTVKDVRETSLSHRNPLSLRTRSCFNGEIIIAFHDIPRNKRSDR